MLYGGIDVGSLTAQAVIVDENKIIGYGSIPVKTNPIASGKTVMSTLLDEKKFTWGDLHFCVSTGYGREELQKEGLCGANMSEISCHGKGAWWLAPKVRTIVDIGGQDAKAIVVDKNGELVNFVMNDKCAAGTGRFLEVMSKPLGVTYHELASLAMGAKDVAELSNRCSIFCETEVLHYLQRGGDKAGLAAGVCRSMSERVASLVRRMGLQKEVTMTGGVAKNLAVRKELEKMLQVRMLTYKEDSQIVGALGAALYARSMGVKK